MHHRIIWIYSDGLFDYEELIMNNNFSNIPYRRQYQAIKLISSDYHDKYRYVIFINKYHDKYVIFISRVILLNQIFKNNSLIRNP